MYPRLLQFGHLVIPTYGVLVAAAVVCGLLLSVALAQRAAVTPEKVWNLGMVAVFGAILGPKLLVVLANLRSFREAPLLVLSLPALRSGALYAGGLALALLACLAYLRRSGLPPLRTLDVMAPAVALGLGLERVGAFAAGYGYGTPTSLPWGVVYLSRFAARTAGVPLGTPLEPVQLFESAAQAGIAALLILLFFRRHRDGEVLGGWLFLSGVAWFFLEFLRGDAGRGSLFGGALSVTQGIAMLAVVAGAALWLRPAKTPAWRAVDAD